ncbi:MAG TPA: NfeD family protein [Gaiellaceae bacterium]|jgi:membrane-bound serine protease (ClpP class)
MLFVGAVLLALFLLPQPWGLVLVASAAVFEIAETLFWVRFSRRWRVRAGAETLIGASAEVVSACRPNGQVRVQGELWRARCEAGAEPGERVRITGRHGLTLLVEPE